MPRPSYPKNVLGLDFVRAVAVLMVMLGHYASSFSFWLGARPITKLFFSGEIGVELFFVLSGFLIGGLLLEIIAAAPTLQNLGIFLVRRWVRTLPLYYLCLIVSLAFFPPLADLTTTALRFGTMTQNLAWPMPGPDYFLGVTWSLAIEEWFYLLFGVALVALAAVFAPRKAIRFSLGLFLTIPLVLRLSYAPFSVWANALQPVVIFRLDEIAYGVLMAVLYARRSVIFSYPGICAAIGVSLITAVWSDHWWPVPASLLPAVIFNITTIGAALLLPAALRLREAPNFVAVPVRAVARQSYALYLIHLTISIDVAQRAFLDLKISAGTAIVISLIAPFILSYLSYRYFEAPILKMRPKQQLTRITSAPPLASAPLVEEARLRP